MITGIGLVTSLGPNTATTWNALRAGRSAARAIELDLGVPHRLATAAYPVNPLPCAGPPIVAILSAAARAARTDAALDPEIEPQAAEPRRVAVVLGLSKGDIRSLQQAHQLLREPHAEIAADTDGCEGAIAEAWRSGWPSRGAEFVARLVGAAGPCLAPIAACATGLVAALQAVDLLRWGYCDIAYAGAADAALEPLLLGAFRKMGVLARGTAAPTELVRPWDRNRSGFLVGEGAAVLVLERADQARARGALPYAEIAGGALGSDAYHLTDLNPDPTGLARLIGLALERADLAPADIDHVNVHGTATLTNDPLECRALRLALGAQADSVSCSANKAQIGHLLGAAGAAELAITCLAIRDGFVPPTLNLTDPDPACDLDGTPLVGKPRPIRAALKLSLGFGGHLAVAVLRRPEGPCRRPVPNA